MAEGANQDPSTLSIYVLEMVPCLLTAIKSGDREQADHALLFMYFTIEYVSKVTREEIIGLEGFKYLITVMTEERSEPRHIAASICHNLYKNNLTAQKMFLQAGGGKQLVQLLMRESEDEHIVVELLHFLQDLVTITKDGRVAIIREHTEELNQVNVHDILNSLVFENFHSETCEETDNLLRILAG